MAGNCNTKPESWVNDCGVNFPTVYGQVKSDFQLVEIKNWQEKSLFPKEDTPEPFWEVGVEQLAARSRTPLRRSDNIVEVRRLRARSRTFLGSWLYERRRCSAVGLRRLAARVNTLLRRTLHDEGK